jgi:hypothetical protein
MSDIDSSGSNATDHLIYDTNNFPLLIISFALVFLIIFLFIVDFFQKTHLETVWLFLVCLILVVLPRFLFHEIGISKILVWMEKLLMAWQFILPSQNLSTRVSSILL